MEKNSESPMEILKQFFDKSTKTEIGKELIKKINFNFQFHVTDGDDFYLEIKDSKYSIKEGESPEKDVEYRTLLEGSVNAFTELFKGRGILWDAVWGRELKAECYGPAQGYVSWLSQFFKIGRREKYVSEFFSD